MLQRLFELFEAEVQKQGVFDQFKFSKTHRSFRRRLEGQTQAIHFSYVKHADDFDVTCDVAIRVDDVEDFLNKGRELLSSREKKDTFTIGAELGNLMGASQKRWPIASESDALSAAKDIALWVENVGLPFFREYSDVSAIRRDLDDTKRANVICPINADHTRAAFNAVYGR